MQFVVLSGVYLEVLKKTTKDFEDDFYYCKYLNPGPRLRSRSGLNRTLTLIVFHSDILCGLAAEGLPTTL
jgi:hypothetical protein